MPRPLGNSAGGGRVREPGEKFLQFARGAKFHHAAAVFGVEGIQPAAREDPQRLRHRQPFAHQPLGILPAREQFAYLFAVGLHPFAAYAHEPVARVGEQRQFLVGQRLAVQRHAHFEVAQRVRV